MAKRDPNHLTPEKDGRFCKRVRGVLYHFGANGDKDAALKEWLAAKPLLLAGKRIVRESRRLGGAVTVDKVKSSFLSACTQKVKAGKLKGGTFDDYDRATDEFCKIVGAGRDPGDLKPDDFQGVREKWLERMGPWSLDRYVQAVRTMFEYSRDTERLIPAPPHYGDSFNKSSQSEKRVLARAKTAVSGERIFSADELKIILGAATGNLRAMIMIAMNGGTYAADLAALRWSYIKEQAGETVLDFDRGKTGGVEWKFVLWPETIAALEIVRAEQVAQRARWNKRGAKFPRNPADDGLIFITKMGRAYHRQHTTWIDDEIAGSASVDLVAQEFDKLLVTLGIKRSGVSFGAFRHTHTTATGDHVDTRAAKRVRGHKISGIESHYDKPSIERLKSVTDLARSRLLPGARNAKRKKR